jgi:hypothetical protein
VTKNALATRKHTGVVKGSIGDIAKQQGITIAEAFMNCDLVAIVDVSGSMTTEDSEGGKKRKDVAQQRLIELQAQFPGKIAVLSFSNEVEFCPSGVPHFVGESTNVGGALAYAKIADDVQGMRFVLISDGEPSDEAYALQVARTYKNHIDTIFVGPENGYGRDFLKRLAAMTGGGAFNAYRVVNLLPIVQKMLEAR